MANLAIWNNFTVFTTFLKSSLNTKQTHWTKSILDFLRNMNVDLILELTGIYSLTL